MITEKQLINDPNIHNLSGLAVDMIMKTALARKALDNITCVFVGLENWEKIISNMINKRKINIVEQKEKKKNLY